MTMAYTFVTFADEALMGVAGTQSIGVAHYTLIMNNKNLNNFNH